MVYNINRDMRAIEFYKRENGKMPVKDFLGELPIKLRAKVVDLFIAIEESDLYFDMPHSRPMEDGIFEFRIQFAGDKARVFYFFEHRGKLILTNGFLKKSQKTPPRELERAKEYKKDHIRRHQQ